LVNAELFDDDLDCGEEVVVTDENKNSKGFFDLDLFKLDI